jgi:hypothetical protein
MDKMREEIENWFMENVDCEDDHFFPRDKARYFTQNLLSLIDTQRCEWTEEDGIAQTGCGTELWFDDIVDEHYAKQCPFCPCCGRRIEVKDGQG